MFVIVVISTFILFIMSLSSCLDLLLVGVCQLYMGVSINGGSPESSMLIGFSLTKPSSDWGYPHLWNSPQNYINIYIYMQTQIWVPERWLCRLVIFDSCIWLWYHYHISILHIYIYIYIYIYTACQGRACRRYQRSRGEESIAPRNTELRASHGMQSRSHGHARRRSQ